MDWKLLTTEDQLQQIKEQSALMPQVIFKHSTRCATSSIAKNRLEKSHTPEKVEFYFLDLLKYRSVSNKIATDFHVHHESPQVLLIKDGECIYDESHLGISMQDLITQL